MSTVIEHAAELFIDGPPVQNGGDVGVKGYAALWLWSLDVFDNKPGGWPTSVPYLMRFKMPCCGFIYLVTPDTCPRVTTRCPCGKEGYLLVRVGPAKEAT